MPKIKREALTAPPSSSWATSDFSNAFNIIPQFTSGSIRVNGDEGEGGSPGTTIARSLYGARAREIIPGPYYSDSTLPDAVAYLEYVAKRYGVPSHAQDDAEFLLTKDCPSFYLQGHDKNGHRFAKELYCGREWCPVCGENWSASHQRRFSRWIDKALRIKTMGYMVFTIPEDIRFKYRTKASLTRLAQQVVKMLKNYGFERGLRRYHFFGDKSTKYHPHLNVIVDGEFLTPIALAAIKREYARILNTKKAVVYYRYANTPAKMVHILKYVLRATFKDARWDVPMALELRGFRNQSWWGSGKWSNAFEWSLSDLPNKREELGEYDYEAIAALEQGLCPICGEPIEWSSPHPICELKGAVNKRYLGAGYWRLADVPIPRYSQKVSASLQVQRIAREVRLEQARKAWYESITWDMQVELWPDGLFNYIDINYTPRPIAPGDILDVHRGVG